MTQEAAVIGKPISHSLSPAIFGFLTHQKRNSLDLNYRACEVSPEELRPFVESFRKNQKGLGLNVTIPHKEKIIALLDEVLPQARAIGAVNVVHRKNGKLFGHNTDLDGILRTFRKHAYSAKDAIVLLIGAGGAARAVAYALGSEKAKRVIIVNPSLSRAQALAEQMSRHFQETAFEVVPDLMSASGAMFDLVVQSTPLGMRAHPETRDGVPASRFFSALGALSFSRNAHALDLIYKPESTPFLEIAQSLGLKPMGGLDMLVGQALETWKIWFDENLDLAVHEKLAAYLRNRPIFLTGFMGAGKSTIGPLLAKQLGWRFFESDDAIEAQAGMKISEIFEKKGEAGFREIESNVILENAFTPKTVLSLGGGALTHPKTREALAKTGRLIFLSADAETLDVRLRSASRNRPLLASLNDRERREKIEALLKQREPFYQQSVFKIDTASLSPEQAANQIRELLQ